jgi:ribosomal protein L2
MEKIKLSLAELLTLEAELNGYVNPQSGEQILSGFLKEKLNLATKYWLTKLSDKLTSKKKTIEVLRDELIKKFGEEKDGNIGIETFLDEEKTKVNPKFIEFQDEWAKLLSEEEEIEYNPLTVADLEKIDSEGNYNLVFKLVKEDLAKEND